MNIKYIIKNDLFFADNFNMICAKLFMCVQEERSD